MGINLKLTQDYQVTKGGGPQTIPYSHASLSSTEIPKQDSVSIKSCSKLIPRKLIVEDHSYGRKWENIGLNLGSVSPLKNSFTDKFATFKLTTLVKPLHGMQYLCIWKATATNAQELLTTDIYYTF